MATKKRRTEDDVEARGERLLTAVERLVEDCDSLIAQVEAYKESVGETERDGLLGVVSASIIADYSTKSAIAGGLTAMPGMLPGAGTVLVVGGSLVDMTLTLKHEVEMILCLTHLYGHDIRSEKERWLAYVLAGVRTHRATAQRNYLADLATIQLDVLPKYTPRQMFKLAAIVMGRLALLSLSRSFVRALPFVGIAVSASSNKLLTASVGWSCIDALERRASANDDIRAPLVDAVVQ
jgi:uncharacterized protein (DUF697 family)